jgi:AcrR family transcriptional regulator
VTAPDRSEPLSRDRIIAEARAQLADEGLDKMSLRRLAARLGVTAPALYAYVTDKQDLLAAVAETGFTELIARFDGITTDDPGEVLREMARVYVGFALEQPSVFRVMFRFSPGTLHVPGSNTLDGATAAFNWSATAVARAQAAGVIHPDHDLSTAEMVLWTASHGSASVLLLGVQDGRTRSIPEFEGLVDAVVDTTLRGLAQPPTT